MKKILFYLVAATITIQAAFATPVITRPTVSIEKTAIVEPMPTVTKKAYSYKELKTLAETKLNRKLTLKEKIGLKLTKKKLNEAFDALPTPAKGGDKSQVAAALLCFFLGSFGVHDFYLGRTWSGIGKLILLVTGILLLIPLFALSIWVIVDLVLILTGTKTPKNGEYTKKI